MRCSSAFHTARWAKDARSKSAPQFAVHARQQVHVEAGGDAGGIIVGGEQGLGVLHQVEPDQQFAGAERRPRAGEKRIGFHIGEVADGRAGKKSDQRVRLQIFRQSDRLHEVADHRPDARSG